MKVQSVSINRRGNTEEGLKLGDATFYKHDESMEARITLSECTPGAIEAIGRLAALPPEELQAYFEHKPTVLKTFTMEGIVSEEDFNDLAMKMRKFRFPIQQTEKPVVKKLAELLVDGVTLSAPDLVYLAELLSKPSKAEYLQQCLTEFITNV